MRLIYVSKNSWWDERKARKVLLPLSFSSIEGNRCLLVNAAAPIWRRYKFPRRWRHPETRMDVFTPTRVLPLQRFKPFRRINQYLQYLQIVSVLKCDRPSEVRRVFILSDPEHGLLADVIRRHGEICYYDWTEKWENYAVAAGSENQHKIRNLSEILESVDGVIVVSRMLEEHVRSRNLRCLFLPNAVSDAFIAAVTVAAKLPLPEILQSCPYPRAAHIGTANPGWIEWDYLIAAARKNPSISFCMIGGKKFGADKNIADWPGNIHFLGNVPYEMLPSIMGHCQAFMLLYRPHETAAGDPTKLYEYLATGLPIVSTCHPRCLEMRQLLYLCRSPSDFAKKIGQAVQEDDAALRNRRKIAASENRWILRAQTLNDWIRSV